MVERWKVVRIRKRNKYFFRVYDEGLLVGRVIVYMYEHQTRITGLFTIPDYRKLGVATTLLNNVITMFGDNPLYLSCHNELIIFYQKFGFIKWEERDSPLVDMVRKPQ